MHIDLTHYPHLTFHPNGYALPILLRYLTIPQVLLSVLPNKPILHMGHDLGNVHQIQDVKTAWGGAK